MSKHFSIKKRNVFLCMVLLPLLETSYIANNLGAIHQIIAILKYCAILTTFVLYFSDRNFRNGLTKPVKFILWYSAIIVLSTVFNSGEVSISILESLQLIAIVLIADMLTKKSLKDYISVVCPIFYVLATINFITMILYPNGMYTRTMEGSYVWVSGNNWFLGLENAMTAYLIPTLALTYINTLIKRTRVSWIATFLMTGMCMYVPIVRHKGSMMVCFLLFILLCVLAYWKLLPTFFNARTYLLANIIFFLVIVVLSSTNTQIIAFIETILSRNTLSIRTIIWQKVLKLVPQKLLFGFGYEIGQVVSDKLVYDSAHNQYLWVLYRGGIAQFIVFAKFIYDTVKALFRKKEYAVVKIVSASFLVLLLMWQTESIMNNVLLLYVIFIYYIGVRGDELYLGEKEFDYKKFFKPRIQRGIVNKG